MGQVIAPSFGAASKEKEETEVPSKLSDGKQVLLLFLQILSTVGIHFH